MNSIAPLKHKEEFRRLLDGYVIGESSARELQKVRLVVLSGVAASGRNTIINELVKTGKYHYIVSDTTRPPKVRDGKLEQHGVNYFFREEDDMLSDIKAGKFIEAELIHDQQVSGTSVREVISAATYDKIALAELEFGGANAIAKAHPGAIMIGLLPPSYDEWLRRLTKREDMSPEELGNRLRTAEKVLVNMLTKPYFCLIKNDSLAQAVEDIREIVERDENPHQHEANRALASDMLTRIRQVLR